MANRLKGEAGFELDGENLLIRINMEMLLRVERESGIGLLEMGSAGGQVGFVTSLFRQGLIEGSGKDIPFSDAAELVFLNSDIRDAVSEAWVAAFPEREETDGGVAADPPVAARKRGAGTKS